MDYKKLPENMASRPEPGTETGEATSSQGLQAVLDNLDALVYVADFNTYELLYLNAYGRRIWGEGVGRRCWEVFQRGKGPCSFCTNPVLTGPDGQPGPPYVWEYRNPVSGRWYHCRDRAIYWTDGRLVRMQIATDITDRKEMEMALKAAHREARAAALRDELTGLYNRRAFFELGERLLVRAKRQRTPVAILMCDLDHFKKINDTYGHEAGDQVLRAIGQLLREKVRDSDIAARIGGEEFALLLPETSVREAMNLADRLLQLLRSLRVEHNGQTIRPTASIGLAMKQPQDTHNLEQLLSRADHAMYLSKAAGRDRLSLYPGTAVT